MLKVLKYVEKMEKRAAVPCFLSWPAFILFCDNLLKMVAFSPVYYLLNEVLSFERINSGLNLCYNKEKTCTQNFLTLAVSWLGCYFRLRVHWLRKGSVSWYSDCKYNTVNSVARHKQQSAGTRAFLLRWAAMVTEKAGAVGSELCHGHGATTGRDQGAAQLSSGPGHTQDRGEALTGPRLGVWAWELRGMPSRLPAAACVLSSPSHSSKEQMCTPDTLLLSFQTININLHIYLSYDLRPEGHT